jgi:tetratricopeptide (TPR) repeat protein
MELGLETNRSPEVIDHIKNAVPELFQSDVSIDENNFMSAYALGALLRTEGKLEQAERLLRGSLKVSQVKKFDGPGAPQNNWECRIHLALGDHQAAVASFVKLAAEGIHTYEIVSNPIYESLYQYPDFEKGMETMQELLKKEQVQVKELDAKGELDIPALPEHLDKENQ